MLNSRYKKLHIKSLQDRQIADNVYEHSFVFYISTQYKESILNKLGILDNLSLSGLLHNHNITFLFHKRDKMTHQFIKDEQIVKELIQFIISHKCNIDFVERIKYKL